jgi:uncharacterized Zn finger protein (UPF0148 family)
MAVAANRETEMAFHCPHCKTVVLSRRNTLCSTCHKPLPADILFTAAQVEEIEVAERERERSRQQREERRQQEAAKARHSEGGGDASMMLGG